METVLQGWSCPPVFRRHSTRTHPTDEKTGEGRVLLPPASWRTLFSRHTGIVGAWLLQSTQAHRRRHLSPPGTVIARYRSPAWVEIEFIYSLPQISLFSGKLTSSSQVSVNLQLIKLLVGFAKLSYFLPACTLSCLLWPHLSIGCAGCDKGETTVSIRRLPRISSVRHSKGDSDEQEKVV